MRIRFLQVVASPQPEFPFQIGQVINIDEPWPALLAALDGVQAEVLRDDAPELAVMGTGERAVTRRPRKDVR